MMKRETHSNRHNQTGPKFPQSNMHFLWPFEMRCKVIKKNKLRGTPSLRKKFSSYCKKKSKRLINKRQTKLVVKISYKLKKTFKNCKILSRSNFKAFKMSKLRKIAKLNRIFRILCKKKSRIRWLINSYKNRSMS